MSDITLFRIGEKVEPVELRAVRLEKEIQTLIERNMEPMMCEDAKLANLRAFI